MHITAHTFSPVNGYGRWARSVVAALQTLGVNVSVSSGSPLPEDLVHLKARNSKPDIAVYPPFTELDVPVQFTTYESTKLTEQMTNQLVKRDLVVVLCEQNRIMCVESGVKNVVVCHPAVATEFHPLPPKRPFVFSHVATDSGVPERKQSALVVKAFQAAFPEEADVYLAVKKAPEDQKIPCFDTRISITYDFLPSLREFYLASHVGVYPCGQEGWGYCQSDSMACGRPVMVPFYGGPADFCDDLCSYRLASCIGVTPKKIYNHVGECAHVSFDSLVAQMRWCYENIDDVALKGVLAYRRMQGFSLTKMASRLAKIL